LLRDAKPYSIGEFYLLSYAGALTPLEFHSWQLT
jgi:hypothetical protein